MSVCIDTHLVIWGVQGTARPGQEEMIERTRALFARLAKDQTWVIVPSVVMGEFLLGIPQTDHSQYQQLISRRFLVHPYDLRASLVFSQIWHKHREPGTIAAIKQSGATKNEVRADMMVVATAVAAGATRLYGHDQGVKKLCGGFIEFVDIADLLLQNPLPDV